MELGSFSRLRLPLLAGFDALAWVVSFAIVTGLQLALGVGMVHGVRAALLVGLVCGLTHVLLGMTVRLHQGRAALGSFEDILLLTMVVAVVAGSALLANLAMGPHFRSLEMLAAPMLAFLMMLWVRGTYRVMRERGEITRSAQGRGDQARPAVIIGAGDAARQLVTALLRDPGTPWLPAALLDDDHDLRHRRIKGVAVMGRSRDFVRVCAAVGADTAIVAIPSAQADLMRDLNDLATEAGITLKVLPSQRDLLSPTKVTISDIRDIDVTDLLGRHQVETDLTSIAACVTGKRVLVTGAGGSIGSELCRQLVWLDPAELIMLDRDESALHTVELSIHGKALLDSDQTVLGDIRDQEFLRTLFEDRRPDVVFHAAALKHLPLLEKAPGEAIKTNVWGTLAVLEAAASVGVETFVNISTDKAANPCSVLGYSKRLAEGLTAAVAERASGTYLSVRFGNVLGSRGSVLTSFAAQIAAGGPVTVTHPGVTRFFMTIPEAVQLVIQAAAIGRDREVLVLDMGDAVPIKSVAEQLIELSGEDIEIVYTGLRAGEKLHEELFGDGEVDERPCHPLISHTLVPAYAGTKARALDAFGDTESIILGLKSACVRVPRQRTPEEAGVPVEREEREERPALTVLLSPPDVGPVERRHVQRAMESGWVAPAGPDLDAFEREVAERVGVRHAVGLSSGTAALHLALVSWGVGPGDVVPVSTLTFAATVNAIRYVGATPYFVDCDPETGNMDPALLASAMRSLTDAGVRVPAVLPVDMLGKCADYTALATVLRDYPATRILSDAAESFGASHAGRAAGSWGDAAVLSFNGNKIMTTSGGGMLLTDDGDLAAHVRKLSTQAREPVPHYEHVEVGYNYRLSNVLAALGRGQLSRLDAMMARRRQWRDRYRTMFAEAPGVRILGGLDDADDNCWLTAVVVDPAASPWLAGDLGLALSDVGVETRPLWKPMHLQPVFADCPSSLNGTSAGLFAHGITLPSGSAMTEDQFMLVEQTVASVVGVGCAAVTTR